jgi:hypothetical protein
MEFRANKRWLRKRYKELLALKQIPASFFDRADMQLQTQVIESALEIADSPRKWDEFKRAIRASKKASPKLKIKPVGAASSGRAMLLQTLFGLRSKKSASRRRLKTTKRSTSRGR